MVNPAICRKCLHCKCIDPPVREKDVLVAEVMIHCGLEGDLTVSVSVPKGCPYELEHTLLKDATEQIKEGWDNERTEQ